MGNNPMVNGSQPALLAAGRKTKPARNGKSGLRGPGHPSESVAVWNDTYSSPAGWLPQMAYALTRQLPA